ncbi:MAG: ketopantoate reductase family protein [Sphaerochaetaceae bacterium]|jgi:2-dehydropantoate 2-reductase|nr:ketopantoate reductase family protein [Sphaerochaetaceae bacterium]NLO60832.1 ketopantoate reductase family protein [Spirochaetales bacterium]MDD2405468.1 ketopantoate reductase family protein [Sphaerochaetaceae bacterium]MDD3670415.1 ketopantoate reductase family protein [Sphaerochaetaceae bacterium]MDD4258585.1 ketopantoate reductase family protein [Sphaerochaetaceae bacterium]
MMTISEVSVIGLGAVGAIYAWRLSEYLGYQHVRVVVDKHRKERYEADKIFLNGNQIHFNYVTPEERCTCADLVLIATKNMHLEKAIDAIASHIGESTMVLSLLNGLDSEALLTQRFSAQNVLYGFTTALDATRDKNRIYFSNEGIIVFGENDNVLSPRICAIQKLFDQSHIKNNIPKDIHLEMWAKFMVNVSINSISAITRATYGQCATITSIRTLIIGAQREVIALAHASGIKGLDEQYIEHYQKVFASLEPSGKTSMLQDVEAKRMSENQWFCLKASQLGRVLNIPTPICDTLGALLAGIDAIHQGKIEL